MSFCYYSFPSLPQYLQSQLDFIFPLFFVTSNLLKTCNHESVFYHLKIAIENLAKGIEICTAKGNKIVHFALGLIIGDNLGLNALFRFTKSFNSKRFCRACSRTRSQMKQDISEEINFLRSEISYRKDLITKNHLETGVKHDCIFNQLDHFHIIDNFYFDLMHDVLEGVCIYNTCNVLLALINEKILTLDLLNTRKQYFPYGEIEVGNSSVPITLIKLKTFQLKMTASEILCFVTFLPLMLGDLIPENNVHWKLLTKLISIIDVLFRSKFENSDILYLKQLIEEHHTLW